MILDYSVWLNATNIRILSGSFYFIKVKLLRYFIFIYRVCRGVVRRVFNGCTFFLAGL